MLTKVLYFVLSILIIVGIGLPVQAQDSGVKYPISVAATETGIYVADRQLPGIWVIAAGKTSIFHEAAKKFGTPLNAIRCLAIDSNGSLLAGDSATRDVYRLNAEGIPTALTGGQIGIPMGIAVSDDGTIYVSDLELHRVVKLTSDGKIIEFAKIKGPAGMSFDKQGNLYVASRGEARLVKISMDGSATPVDGADKIRFSQDVAVDANGRVLVTDGYGKAIWDFKDGAARLIEGSPLIHPVGISSSAAGTFLVDPRGAGVLKLDGVKAIPVLSE